MGAGDAPREKLAGHLLRPREDPEKEEFLQVPNLVGDTGSHSRGARLPEFGCPLAFGGERLRELEPERKVGQAEVVIGSGQADLLVQTEGGFGEAQDLTTQSRNVSL